MHREKFDAGWCEVGGSDFRHAVTLSARSRERGRRPVARLAGGYSGRTSECGRSHVASPSRNHKRQAPIRPRKAVKEAGSFRKRGFEGPRDRLDRGSCVVLRAQTSTSSKVQRWANGATGRKRCSPTFRRREVDSGWSSVFLRNAVAVALGRPAGDTARRHSGAPCQERRLDRRRFMGRRRGLASSWPSASHRPQRTPTGRRA